jgi:hypothetical protein
VDKGGMRPVRIFSIPLFKWCQLAALNYDNGTGSNPFIYIYIGSLFNFQIKKNKIKVVLENNGKKINAN